MKKLSFISKIALILGAFIFLFSSCDEERKDPTFKGENELILKADKKTIDDVEGDAGKLTVNVLLTQSLDKDLTLKFAIAPTTEACSLEKDEIVIAKGAKTGVLTVKAKGDGNLEKTLDLKIKLVSSSEAKVKLKEELGFSVNPMEEGYLTPAQKELVEHYEKDQFNKLYVSLLGNTEVKLSVKYPGDANFVDFPTAGNKEYTSTTLFTLSEKATKEQLVLKMKKNAMGLNDFLYEVITNMTHKNEYWAAWPFANEFKALIDFNKHKDFNVTLDNIAREGHGFSFVSTVTGNYGDQIPAVPFTYTYSAWDELQNLVKTNESLINWIKEEKKTNEGFDPALAGGTLNPNFYLNKEDIVENQHEEGALFTKSEVSFDHATFSLIFTFCLAYDNADDYMQFKAVYQLKK